MELHLLLNTPDVAFAVNAVAGVVGASQQVGRGLVGGSRINLGSGWGLLLGCALLEIAIVATPFYWVRVGHVSRELATWKAVLELTRPDEMVLDPKGEMIFRNRAFYWGLEKITRTRLDRGLIDPGRTHDDG